MIEVELPDGTIAEFPDGMSNEDISAVLSRQFAAPAPQQEVATAGKQDREVSLGDQALDVVQSLGSGLRQGVESTLGLPGDMARLQGDIAGGIASAVGAGPETAETIQNVASRLTPFSGTPTTEQIRSGTTSVIGEPRTPETTAGEFAQTVGEFIPAAVAPGGVARRAAQVVVPALASEAAGQATEGTEAEPFARAGAALLGGLTVAGRAGAASKGLIKGAPTADQLSSQKKQLYGRLQNSGVIYNTKALENSVVRLKNDLTVDGLLPELAPKTFSIIDRIEAGATQGQIADFNSIEAMRKVAGRLVRGSDSEERAAAMALRDAIDDFTASAPLVNQGNMARSEFVRTQKQARELARREIQGRSLGDIIENAQNTAGGVEAGIRNGVNSLLRSKRGKKLFRTPEERKALRQVSNGRKTLQQLSRFGFDVTGGSGNAALIPGATALTGAATGNPLAIGATVGGTVAKQLSPALTKRALAKAQALVRAGPQAQKQALKAEEIEALEVLVRRAIAANNALASGGQ